MPVRSYFSAFSHPHFLDSKLRSFYFATVFARLAAAVSLIVTPLYLFSLGSTLPFFSPFFGDRVSQSLAAACSFYLLHRIYILILQPFLVRILSRVGFTGGMILGQVFFLLFVLMAPLLSERSWLFFLLPLWKAGYLFFYFVSHNTYFSTEVKMRETGREVGTLHFLVGMASVVTPLLSALLATTTGFHSAFFLSAVCQAISLSFLLRLPSLTSSTNWSLIKFFHWLRREPRTAFSLSARGWEEWGHAVLWPLFLFVTFGQIITVGYIMTSAGLLALFLTYFSGWYFDHHRKSSLARLIAGSLMGLVWVPRAVLSGNPLTLVVSEAVGKIVSGVYDTFFFASVVLQSRKEGVYLFYLHREYLITLTSALGTIILLLLLTVGWNWFLLFASFGLGVAASSLLLTHYKDS